MPIPSLDKKNQEVQLKKLGSGTYLGSHQNFGQFWLAKDVSILLLTLLSF